MTLQSPLDSKEIQSVNPKGSQSWIFIGRTDAEAPILVAPWWEELTYLKRPWCLERLKAGGEGDNKGWDGWMASLTRWTWVWASFGSWWWTGMPGMLQSMGSQRVGRDWATELNWRYIKFKGDCETKFTEAFTGLNAVTIRAVVFATRSKRRLWWTFDLLIPMKLSQEHLKLVHIAIVQIGREIYSN